MTGLESAFAAYDRLLEAQEGIAHCDARVCHSPGTCDYCDRFPTLQKHRRLVGMQFTNEEFDGRRHRLPCPALHARGLTKLESWGGNIAHVEL